MRRLRLVVRLAPLFVLASLLAACVSYKHDGTVSFVPGYGYVVEVREYRRSYFFDEKPDYYYYVFTTEDEARRFMATLRADPYSNVGVSHRPRYEDKAPDGKIIEYYLQRGVLPPPPPPPSPPPPPPGDVMRPIERVMPPSPTAPAPR